MTSSQPLPLSIVVVAYDIARELPRTLRSLSADYQRGVAADDYEVVVVDNGSPTPLDESIFDGLDGAFRLVRVDDAPPSPAAAANLGLKEARGETVGVMLDGARIVTPGLVHAALAGSHVHPRSGIVTLGWYLGYDFQRSAMGAGWSKDDEDRLLESISWPDDGYRLFEVATMDESSVDGWFFGAFESNCLFLPASVWREIGGFDERFDLPGGGIVNHDVFRQAADLDDVGWVVLLGEATFHQLHGGVATNVDEDRLKTYLTESQDQFRSIRGGGEAQAVALPDAVFLGRLPAPLRARFGYAVSTLLHAPAGLDTPLPPQVEPPDHSTAPDPMSSQWLMLAAHAIRHGRNAEALRFARQARLTAPGSTAPLELLQFLASARYVEDLPPERQAQFFVDEGDAYARGGDPGSAERSYRRALEIQPGVYGAYEGLSALRMPGPDYHDRLRRIHETLNPATYLEVGVFEGESLAHARPPTVAVGVDPDPKIREPISVEFHLYHETSSEFFTRDVRGLFGGDAPSLVFIDGLHEFSAVLADFAAVEAIADPDTVILLHDMLPFDEPTQRAEREHFFYTGDVWKLLHCLADVRPDLSWFTIKTPPSGLTLVSNLDPTSTTLHDSYDKLVARYGALRFEDSLDTPGPVVENDWAAIERQLATFRTQDSSSRVVTAPAALADTERLTRRIRELEAAEADHRREIAALKKAARATGSLMAPIDEKSALAELERLRATKLFRYSRAFRRVYSRVRRRGDVA